MSDKLSVIANYRSYGSVAMTVHCLLMAAFKRGWLRRGRIYGDGFSVSIEDRTHMAYRSRGKKMTISGEVGVNGFAGNLANTTTWDDGTPVDALERQQIIDNVKRAFASQGQVADFD